MLKSSILFVLSCILFTACQAAGSPSAGQAAAETLLAHPGEGVVVDPDSIAVVQTHALEPSTFVVLAYQRMWNERDEQCLVLYETHYQMFAGWSSSGGAGMCSERKTTGENTGNQPLHVSSGMTNRSGQNQPDFSYVLGKINDPRITKVMVTWDDGQAQEAQVANNTFAAVRTGRVEMKGTDGLNSGNAVIYSAPH
jgi:hypothetical protein